MITVQNDGPDIASTNYWESAHAARGLCYLSGNAGALRLLAPTVDRGMSLGSCVLSVLILAGNSLSCPL